MSLAVLSAAGGGAWEETWVAAFAPGAHGVRIVRRCVDVVDLLAAAAAGQGRVALIDAGLRRLDVAAIDRLRATQVIPVGVVLRGDTAAEDRLRAAGITHLVPADADPAVVASVVLDALSGTAEDDGARAARTFGDPSTSMAIPPGAAPHPPPGEPGRNGSLIAVWGPTGAPGRTTVAIGLADELARLGATTLLVDADVYGATIAATLGLLDESPGLAAACRQAGIRRLTPTALAGLSWQLSPQLRVLTGLPLAQRWPELRPAGVEAVLATGRSMADFVVVDCGFCLETDEELSFDTVAPRRNGATLAVLDAADLVLAVGSADPIGMQRLVRGLADLRDTGLDRPVRVVLNRVRRGVVPGDPQAELTAALERFAGRPAAALLPADQESIDVALASGRTLAEARPNSALRRALVELAAAVAGVRTPSGRRR
ncbi:MAG: hypothetical protein QOD45_1052 [Pseudonocardiales bacterium]|jgi:MinD-like ATPase involved in chromosome partitioning or flagellar assembly|nr:hypothetical protein [Pseudonocardiales bacterium]